MDRPVVPAVALVVATSWLAAQATTTPVLAAAVAIVALGGTAGTALVRRSRPLRLAAALAVVLLALAAFLLALLLVRFRGSGGLLLQLVFLAALAPVVPLLYALTFDREEEE